MKLANAISFALLILITTGTGHLILKTALNLSTGTESVQAHW